MHSSSTVTPVDVSVLDIKSRGTRDPVRQYHRTRLQFPQWRAVSDSSPAQTKREEKGLVVNLLF